VRVQSSFDVARDELMFWGGDKEVSLRTVPRSAMQEMSVNTGGRHSEFIFPSACED